MFFSPVCTALNKYDQALLVATQVFVGIILAIRVYALWNRNKWILWLIILMALGFGGVAGWSIASAPDSDVTGEDGQCPEPGIAPQTAIRHAVAWDCMFAFDTIIFALTMVRGYRATRESGRRLSVPLVDVMLRDGAIYFL
ncbi:hypothetical protein DL96DRAFT_1566109 [Flagelloscypha sp. PMI_526]|nr:hypothetical protein DL96DRAFT_1566109 [Flagelloscypha sp. PMI_526]